MNFSDIQNINMLAEFLGITPQALRALLNSNQSDWYLKMDIQKKNPILGYRTVYKVLKEEVKNIQKNIQYNLDDAYTPPNSVHGFVNNRNIKRNADKHLAKKKILSLDFSNFFESIDKKRVERIFIDVGCKKSIANALSIITTHKNKLIQGLNTSPVISNLATRSFDNEMEILCSKFNADYTRYSDDISISSNNYLPDLKDIKRIVEKNGFKLNWNKTKTMFRGEKQYVTGLAVFDNKYSRIPKRFKKRIRLELYYMNKYGVESHVARKYNIKKSDFKKESDFIKKIHPLCSDEINKIKGWIDYINAIEPNLAKKLYYEYNVIIKLESLCLLSISKSDSYYKNHKTIKKLLLDKKNIISNPRPANCSKCSIANECSHYTEIPRIEVVKISKPTRYDQ